MRQTFLKADVVYVRQIVMILSFVMFTLLTTGCHSSKKSGKGRAEVKVETIKTGKLKGLDKKIVEESLTWVGTPYKYAGSDKGKGTDCSGLVLKVYEDVVGVKLPRNSGKQAEFCKKIGKKSVKAGDLVFFATGKDKKKISHVGIMIDDVQFVHASTRKGVIVSEVTTPYYQRTFMMYGRVLRDSQK